MEKKDFNLPTFRLNQKNGKLQKSLSLDTE